MRLIFMGTPHAAVPTLARLLADGHEVVAVWTQPDKPAGRGNKLHASPVKEFALEHQLTVEQPAKIKTAAARELFNSYHADAAVVVAYGRILPPALLSAPHLGCINVHFSLLPKYRGAAPVNWAIARGETETGVTTMRMDAGLDMGDMLLQHTIAIGADETSVELMARLAETGAELLSETLRRIDEIEPQAQNHADATLAPLMSKEDGAIDWHLSAREIHNRVRGFHPFPTSYTHYGGKKLTLWKTTPDVGYQMSDVRTNVLSEPPARIEGGHILSEPPAVAGGSNAAKELGEIKRAPTIADAAVGQVVAVNKTDFIVRCGADTFLTVKELQLEGKRRMTARDFLNGTRLEVGTKFG